MKKLSFCALAFAGLIFAGCNNDKSDPGGEGGQGDSSDEAPSCTDGIKNANETDIDCGGDCSPCENGQACSEAADCSSEVCTGKQCVAPSCGDGVKNGSEECDEGGIDTANCDKDCTAPKCGDSYVNSAANELCERSATADLWDRCNTQCTYGVLLSGEFIDTPLGQGGAYDQSPWEELNGSDDQKGLQSFHYSGQKKIVDLAENTVYDLEADTWSELPNTLPYSSTNWADGAVDAGGVWVPRGGKMHRLSWSDFSWTEEATDIPDGSRENSAAVYDGYGLIWYAGGGDTLVSYDPKTDAFASYSYADKFENFDVYETRLAYDPLTNKIAFTGFSSKAFLVFDLGAHTFSLGSTSPGGTVNDNSCQDRAGGIYTGSNEDPTKMYRYDIGKDTWTVLPTLPLAHDNNSTCVVSEDGYLYYATSEDAGGFFRLKLVKK